MCRPALRSTVVSCRSSGPTQRIGVAGIMQTDDLEAVVRNWAATAWNSGDLSIVPTLFSPSYRMHEMPEGFGQGPEGIRAFVESFRNAFPDLHFSVDDVVVSGNKIAWRVTGTGTSKGE